MDNVSKRETKQYMAGFSYRFRNPLAPMFLVSYGDWSVQPGKISIGVLKILQLL